ncbi:hypothetical protein [Piscirickettsia litoralis]|uniref:Uncharacterized protein n=1 Tax=Piscirickettsia litoralis TaxID=1891921 RepID=A0ABX3A1W0_9GAMM|nr:hypothetical protein [Piscirickettsia litoralis]ODN42217.1 hypothetical protein BGC07_03785 [Piscirickettsia litoralis]
MPKGQTFDITFDVAGIVIPGASIHGIDVKLTPYGHKTIVNFFVSNQEGNHDYILEKLQAPFALEATLSLVNCYYPAAEREQSRITIKGIICEKHILKQSASIEVTDNPTYSRCYSVTFIDRACAFWSQHKPARLYTNTNYKQIIATHSFDGLNCSSELDAFSASQKNDHGEPLCFILPIFKCSD